LLDVIEMLMPGNGANREIPRSPCDITLICTLSRLRFPTECCGEVTAIRAGAVYEARGLGAHEMELESK
jgi:hypothetical protein